MSTTTVLVAASENPWIVGPYEVTVHDEFVGEWGRYGEEAWTTLVQAEAYAREAIREGWPTAVIRSADAIRRTYLSTDYYAQGEGWRVETL